MVRVKVIVPKQLHLSGHHLFRQKKKKVQRIVIDRDQNKNAEDVMQKTG